MAKACYDPRESARVFERLAKLNGEAGSKYLSTHPAHSDRISDLKRRMPQAMEEFHEHCSDVYSAFGMLS